MTASSPDGWAAGRLARSLARRFRDGWSALPAAARRCWLRTVGVGFVGIVALITALEWVGRGLAADGVLAGEADLLRWLDAQQVASFSTAVWIQTLGTDITLVLVILFTAGLAVWFGRTLRAATIVASVALVDPVIRVGWRMWDRARPEVIMDGLAAPGFASFPSGHTAKSVALYGLLAYFWVAASRSALERAIAVGVWAIIIACVMFGRLRMGVHWPSDIVAGLLLGLVWLALLILALRRARSAA